MKHQMNFCSTGLRMCVHVARCQAVLMQFVHLPFLTVQLGSRSLVQKHQPERQLSKHCETSKTSKS